MRTAVYPSAALLALSLVIAHADLVDDFAEAGWKLFTSTPGVLKAEKGSLYLRDAEGGSSWVTASKVFAVDLDQTPFFLARVADVSDRGTVKLIRREPYDKRVALEIDRPGLYAVDMRSRFGWKGACNVEVCLYALGEEEGITYEFVKFAAQLTDGETALIKERSSGGNVRLDVPPFAVVPSFTACSVYFTSPKRERLDVLYRSQGGDWRKAYPLAHFPEDNMYRGSIVDLEENTAYELKVTDGTGAVLTETSFNTWSSEVPLAKTIVLDAESFDGHLKITEGGSPDGWIRYTAPRGFVLRNDRTSPLIELSKAKYVLLEGLVLRGGLKEALVVDRCEQVRLVNCDIAGWGRIGTQRFDLDGKFYTKEGMPLNWDSAIRISKSFGTVVERCYIHDPVSTANSWYCSHPAGPQAVGIDKPQSTVLRYNDFLGSDRHRWNDAVEGAGNFHLDGGFNRDADLYGNLMCFANDDALEIDGGQTNVRVFDNKFEGCLCGVSLQGCMSSPSYVFRNLLVNMGDERGMGGQTIKTSSFANGPSAVSFLFNNTCFGNSRDLNLPGNLRLVALNNIFAGKAALSGRKRSPQSECDYNLLSTEDEVPEAHSLVAPPGFIEVDAGLFGLRETSAAVGAGTALANFAPATGGRLDMGAIPAGSGVVLPVRPIPVYLDRYQLRFSPADTKVSASRTVTASVKGQGFSSRYRIAKNDAFDWLRVTPAEGTLRSGQTTQFTVSVVPEKMTYRRHYRGAFLLRLANGYSRPVMVYAETDYVPPVKPSREGVFVRYLEAESPVIGAAHQVVTDPAASQGKCLVVAGEKSSEPVEYRFTVPKPGSYLVLMRVRSDEPASSHDSLSFAVDDGQLGQTTLRTAPTWTWSMAAHNNKQRLTCLQPFKLQAGEHRLRIAPRESLYLDMLAVTDNPKMFD